MQPRYICIKLWCVMWELLRDILTSPTGSFAFILALMLGAGWVLIQATRFTTKWSEKMRHSEKKVETLEQNIDGMRADISYIKGMMGVILSNDPNALTKSHSPVSLTELGRKITDEMGVGEMVQGNWVQICECIS